jgi:hypothetical protein
MIKRWLKGRESDLMLTGISKNKERKKKKVEKRNREIKKGIKIYRERERRNAEGKK